MRTACGRGFNWSPRHCVFGCSLVPARVVAILVQYVVWCLRLGLVSCCVVLAAAVAAEKAPSKCLCRAAKLRLQEVYSLLCVLFSGATWLILPLVICLSQRLSHASASINFNLVKLRMAHYSSYSPFGGLASTWIPVAIPELIHAHQPTSEVRLCLSGRESTQVQLGHAVSYDN